MNFYETQAGRIFFEGQLPKLIKSLQDIAAALSRPAQVVNLPLEPKPDFLSDLYWGKYEPSVFHRNENTKNLDAAVISTRAALTKVLPDEAQALFEAYQEAVDARGIELMEQSYESGCRTAVQLILAGLSTPKEPPRTEAEH